MMQAMCKFISFVQIKVVCEGYQIHTILPLISLLHFLPKLFLPTYSIQFSHSVTSNPATPQTRSTPGLPVHHQLLEFTQTYVHRIGDAIQPSHPLLSPSPPALSLSQHQGLFKMTQLFK